MYKANSITTMTSNTKRSTIFKNIDLYLMLVPGLLFFLIFHYLPMFGLTIAFQDYSIGRGIFGSEWVGLKHFSRLFSTPSFYKLLRNTILINIYKLIFGFPFPVILAILLNEVRKSMIKRSIQTIIYLPHFLSWVVVAGMVIDLLSVNSGLVNRILVALGQEPVSFIVDKRYFRSILVISDIWKGAGWGTIIYLAALSGINPELYEAARIDGASKLQQIIYITIPEISSTIIVLLILNLGSILTNGFEQILMLYNVPVYEVADVISTYVYRVGIVDMKFSYTTAVGLFQSLVGFILVFATNKIARKVGDYSIW